MSVVIRIDPDLLRSTANQLDNEHQDIDQKLRETISMISNLNWTGLTRDDYLNLSTDSIQQSQQVLEKVMEEMIGHLRRIANTFQEADAGGHADII